MELSLHSFTHGWEAMALSGISSLHINMGSVLELNILNFYRLGEFSPFFTKRKKRKEEKKEKGKKEKGKKKRKK